MKIFLGDLVHTWGKISVWTMPLNIGYVAGYAAKQLSEPLDVRLFKRPEKMIEAIRRERPDVVALSHYVWNSNLNALVAKITKEVCPHALVVGGGASFTNLNADQDHAVDFFAKSPHVDAFILNQGERGFATLLQRFLDENGDVERLRRTMVDGSLINNNGSVLIGAPLDALTDLDDIPSPYLTGMIDEFFDEPIAPIIETNRSCPYRCTFCAWGIGTNKLTRFSEQRVLAEMDYIAERCTKSSTLFIADANFGILERDAVFGDHLWQLHQKHNYPQYVAAQWNKTRPDRVIQAVRSLRGLSQVGASMQSLHEPTLKAIERKNLGLDQVLSMHATLKEEGIPVRLFSELILGLPEETAETHIAANRKMVDIGAEVFNYNLHLLPGTKMESQANRDAYFQRTGWRLHDNAYGVYDGTKVFEGQEVVQETKSMSFSELSGFRMIHFLLQMMWGSRHYYDFLVLLRQEAGTNPVDVVLEVNAALREDDSRLKDMVQSFLDEQELEFFPTAQDLFDYWSEPEHFSRLESGDYGKLNYVYTFRMLLEYPVEFGTLLQRVAGTLADRAALTDKAGLLRRCGDVLNFLSARRISFAEDGPVASVSCHLNHDVVQWRSDGYAQPLANYASARTYHFSMTPQQEKLLSVKFKQFKNSNLNMVLRKMSEYSDPEHFFYQVMGQEDIALAAKSHEVADSVW